MSDITDNQKQRLMDLFYEEAQSLIDEMRKDLSALAEEKAPKVKLPERSSVFHRLFRCAHTLKGSSGIVGFGDLEDLSRSLERIFRAAKDEKLRINADVVSLLSESIEACQKLLNKEEVVDYKGLMERLDIPR